jgi:uncharacterized membrane protein YkvA (DUF1232 family)
VTPRIRKRRGKGRENTVVKLLRELPNLVKLLVRLLRDTRISKLDKGLFGVVLSYVLLPADLLPDFFGVIGLTDDLYLIGLSLNHLFKRAGADILLEHWDGAPRALGYLLEGIEEVGGALPRAIRNTLRRFV